MFEGLDFRYRRVYMLTLIVVYVALMALALLLLLLDVAWPCIVAEGVLAVALAVNLIVAEKAVRFKGYEAGGEDFSWRSGIFFPKVTTIPYSRIQQVSVGQNPISKACGLYSLEIVNGAQAMAAITVPGLTEETAGRLKQLITSKLRADND